MTHSVLDRFEIRYIAAGFVTLLLSFFFVYDAFLAVFCIFALYLFKVMVEDDSLYTTLILLTIPVIYSFVTITMNTGPIVFYLIILSTFVVHSNKIIYKPFSSLFSIKKDYFTILFIVLLVYELFSIKFISIEKTYGILKFKYFFITVYSAFIIYKIVQRSKSLNTIFKSYIVCGLLIFAISVIHFLRIDTGRVIIDGSIPNRLTLFRMNPIPLGRLVSMFLFSALFYLLEFMKDFKKKIINITLLIPVMLYAVYLMLLTASRGPLLGFIAGVLAIVSFKLRSGMKTIFGIVLIILLIAAVISFAPSKVQDRITQKDSGSNSTIMIRIMLNIQAFEMFMNHKILGAGFGSFETTGWGYPHNVFTEILSELGIFLFLAFVYLLVKLCILFSHNIDYIRNRSDIQIIIAMLVSGFINANFSGHIGGNVEFWVFAYLTYQILMNLEKDNSPFSLK